MKKDIKKIKKRSKPQNIFITQTVEEIFDFVDANFSKADLHIHTNYSDSIASVEEVMEHVATKTDLKVIAITDHDTISGAKKAQRICQERNYDLEVIIGEEVSTTEGHVIGLFLTKKVQPKMTPRETIKAIHRQGGLAIAAHPFYQSRFNDENEVVASGIGATALIHNQELFDAVEVINGTPIFNRANAKAKYFNRMILLTAEVGGSDSHFLGAIGKGYTLFPGKTALDLKKAIKSKTTQGLKKSWEPLPLLKYAYSFLPNFLRIFFFTLLLGPQPKKHEIINFPPRYKIRRELFRHQKERPPLGQKIDKIL